MAETMKRKDRKYSNWKESQVPSDIHRQGGKKKGQGDLTLPCTKEESTATTVLRGS
jgi:hypothetical protein